LAALKIVKVTIATLIGHFLPYVVPRGPYTRALRPMKTMYRALLIPNTVPVAGLMLASHEYHLPRNNVLQWCQ
jgi:hypothetical protein